MPRPLLSALYSAPSLALLLALFTAVPMAAQGGSQTDSTRQAIEWLKSTSPGVEVTVSRRTGAAAWVRAGDAPIELSTKSSMPAELRAREFLSLHKSALGLPTESELLLKRTSDVDEVGMEHVRFQQTHRGIPVTGAELVVHLRGSSLVAVSSKAVPNLDSVPTEPQLSADEAAWIAQDDVGRRFGIYDAEISEPRPEILDRGLLEGGGRFPVQLAWFVEARTDDFWHVYWIDALEGDVVLDFDSLRSAKDRQVSDAENASTGYGTIVREEGDGATGIDDVDDLYTLLGQFYDYFSTYHGRDSYDDDGKTMKATARWCTSAACTGSNAAWNGVATLYTEGMVTDDIVGHEMTHALVNYSADFYYYMQSGALDESYADIFGEILDQRNDQAGEPTGDEWSLGEESAVGEVRNMYDPTLKGDPGKMSDSQLNCASPGGDRGGIHTNSGIPNHAFALLVDGGSYNGLSIPGIGLTRAEKVYYRALTQYLVSGSDFLDNAQALEQACSDLIGNGVSSANCIQLSAAIDMVEMEDPWACTALQDDADAGDLCPSGYDVEVHYSTDFSTTSDWSFGGSPGWRRNTQFALTGESAMRCNSQESQSTDWLTLETDISIPGDDTYLQFDHSFGFYEDGSTYYDGGQVLYSPNAGGNWLSLASRFESGVDYNGTLPASVNNPLGSVEAFVGDSYGYVESRYALTSFFGQDLRMGFRVGSATSDDDDYGWFIDSVTIYSCSSCVGWDITGDEDGDGICNDTDNCADDSNPDQDNADGDSLGDVCDDCPYDADNDADSDDICGDVDNCPDTSNASQTDSDSDDIGDACDDCPNDPDNDIDSDLVCGNVDNCPSISNADQADTDSDLFGDACDVCVNDPDNDIDSDSVCGDVDNCPAISNADQADADSDDYGDVCDACPYDPDNDADADSVCGDVDNCPDISNVDQADADSDDIGDACDACVNDPDNDIDSDLVCGDVDNCPADSNADQNDADSDDIGDACDTCPNDPDNDSDSDLVCGDVDNCPADTNADQADADADDIGDVCDTCPNDPDNDVDSDLVCGDVDNCPAIGNADQADSDEDGIGDLCDACVNDPFNDADVDGVCGDVDNCPAVSNADQANADSDALGDACDACPNDPLNDLDMDGVCGDVDNCPDDSNANQSDSDGDGIGNACDLCFGDNQAGDGDEDGVCADVDNCPDDANGTQTDSDGDGIGNACDLCFGDNGAGDADGDGLCADVDCNDDDAGNACSLIFGDGLESGDTSAWSATVN